MGLSWPLLLLRMMGMHDHPLCWYWRVCGRSVPLVVQVLEVLLLLLLGYRLLQNRGSTIHIQRAVLLHRKRLVRSPSRHRLRRSPQGSSPRRETTRSSRSRGQGRSRSGSLGCSCCCCWQWWWWWWCLDPRGVGDAERAFVTQAPGHHEDWFALRDGGLAELRGRDVLHHRGGLHRVTWRRRASAWTWACCSDGHHRSAGRGACGRRAGWRKCTSSSIRTH
mmetsp:Transcript_66182/g.143590  ORF Transcript_66182/g.143590 Transcript_66182/m.143590 type:complete len:221 (-) Transcript_66182:206-868(-)